MNQIENIFESLVKLTNHHKNNCLDYRSIIDSLNFPNSPSKIADIPYLPARLFKLLNLKSVPDGQVHKILNSSGTSNQGKTNIFLDKKNSFNQIRALSSIIGERIGKEKRPLLILDSKSEIDLSLISARKAGISGISFFGMDIQYALDSNMKLDLSVIQNFIKKHSNEEILLYGFTFIIWEFILNPLLNLDKIFDFSNGTLIHGGGWKKVENLTGRDEFNNLVTSKLKLTRNFNYYGMIEQTGSIFLECQSGYFHTNSYATVLTRRAYDFSVADVGEEGIIQVLSVLPSSYPGHSILTEDVGTIYGQDNCACGQSGLYFVVRGRLKNSEIRGCSDTFEQS
jgi:hypothetical protein